MPNIAPESPTLLTIPEVSERLRVSVYTIRRLIHRAEDQIPALRVGSQIRVSERELEGWLYDDPSPLRSALAATAHARRATALPRHQPAGHSDEEVISGYEDL